MKEVDGQMSLGSVLVQPTIRSTELFDWAKPLSYEDQIRLQTILEDTGLEHEIDQPASRPAIPHRLGRVGLQ